jgi:hypothetical protein
MTQLDRDHKRIKIFEWSQLAVRISHLHDRKVDPNDNCTPGWTDLLQELYDGSSTSKVMNDSEELPIQTT